MTVIKNNSTNTDTARVTTKPSALSLARQLHVPSHHDMLQRTPSVERFWHNHSSLLQQAWREWDYKAQDQRLTLDDSLLDKRLRDAVNEAWDNPQREGAVSQLWNECITDVYEAQFFDPERLSIFRKYLEHAFAANIPTRPPYGIALNRNGAMLDPRSVGYLGAPSFQMFYRHLMDYYMRPIARLLFSGVYGYDTQTFGFSIQYQPAGNNALQPHSDASTVTFNINLNTPDEKFTGSEVDFFDRDSGQTIRTVFTPGKALIHRGSVPHVAHAITSGQRSNMVLWLYGDNMQVPRGDASTHQVSPELRWKVPTGHRDGFAPF